MFRFSSLFGLVLQLLHLAPPVVGLLLLRGTRTTEGWRTWAVISFGLAVVGGLASIGLTLLVVRAGLGSVAMGAYGFLQGLLSLVSLAASGFGVAAVLADRRTGPTAPPAP